MPIAWAQISTTATGSMKRPGPSGTQNHREAPLVATTVRLFVVNF
jgi:hypothetical protein